MTRHPLSLHGVPRDGSPASSVLLRCYDALSPSCRASFPSLGSTVDAPASLLPQDADASAVGLDLWSPGARPGFVHGGLRVLPGFWANPGVCMPWADTPGEPRHQAYKAPRLLPSARPKTSAPRLSLSRLVTTAYTLAVYASQRRVTPTPRKTRFRWGASPCRVGFGPTGSATKGFRFCLLHMPSSLPSLTPWREGRLSRRVHRTESRQPIGSPSVKSVGIPRRPDPWTLKLVSGPGREVCGPERVVW